jgi:DNA polymerase-3 subunit gamma/tau
VRDSLSVLDQLIAGSGEEGLTYEGAAALLGFTDGELLDAIVDAFAAGDAAGVFHQIDRVIETGLDPRRFVEDLLERLRDLIVVAAVPDGASSVLRGVPEDQLERMRQQSTAFGSGALSRAADIVNAGLTEMTGATAPRLQLELICARVLLPGASGESGYAARLDRLERRLDVEGVPSVARPAPAARQPAPPTEATPSPAMPQPAPAMPQPASAVATPPSATPAPATPASEPAAPAPARSASPAPEQQASEVKTSAPSPAAAAPASPPTAAPTAPASPPPATAAAPTPESPRSTGGIDTAAIRRAWPDILGWIFKHKRTTWTLLSEHATVHEFDGSKVVLGISTVGIANTFRHGPHADLVRQALIDVLGVDARVEGIPTPGAPTPGAPAAGTPDSSPDTSAHEQPSADQQPPPAASNRPAAQEDRSASSAPSFRAPESGADGWASAASSPDSGPSWAAAPDAEEAVAPSPRPATTPSGSPLQRARAEVAAETPAGPAAMHVADDSVASADDEDIEALGEVGRPVIERLLGGRVIDEGP